MVRLLSGLQVWQICENYFLFIVLKADGKALSLELRPRYWRVLPKDLPRPLILAINIELFSLWFSFYIVALALVVLIICSLKLHLHMARKYPQCVVPVPFFPIFFVLVRGNNCCFHTIIIKGTSIIIIFMSLPLIVKQQIAWPHIKLYPGRILRGSRPLWWARLVLEKQRDRVGGT